MVLFLTLEQTLLLELHLEGKADLEEVTTYNNLKKGGKARIILHLEETTTQDLTTLILLLEEITAQDLIILSLALGAHDLAVHLEEAVVLVHQDDLEDKV